MTGAQIQTTAIPLTSCPACHHPLAAVTGTGIPAPGCVTICAYCRVLLIFVDDLAHRLLSNQEWAALPQEYRVRITRLRDELPAAMMDT